MCGFAGFLGGPAVDKDVGQAVLRRMSNAIANRGPDDEGFWLDETVGLGLGHRRLSVVDLSVAGHQPMRSSGGRFVLVFNGEIYNHQKIRQELENALLAPAWRGHSDTETLLAGFEAWGVESTIRRTIGMFAFAVWDRETRALILGRDRLGEKPLYYGWQGFGVRRAFLFGSELKALRAHPSFEGKVDRGSLSLQLRNSCIPAPYSIYEGIAKLPPGCLLSISAASKETRIWTYWSAAEVAEKGVADKYAGEPAEAINLLESLLKDAVRQQMEADVPLGAFLSGGIDSSTIVALMQAQSARPVQTFSIGFHEDGFNEAEHAHAVARHLGTEHTELYLTSGQAQSVISRLPTLYDEPFSDSSQIPTFLVAELARKHVTVSLSGDGGDELFSGYTRYSLASKLWGTIAGTPRLVRDWAATGLTAVSQQRWDSVGRALAPLLPASLQFASLGYKLHKGAHALGARSLDDVYMNVVSHWHDPASVVIGGSQPPTKLMGAVPELRGLDGVERMMALDLLTYLPDDILTKVDRAAMGVSLETRVPMLDHRLVEFAWRLPQDLKLREGQSKWILRQVLYRYVPKSLIDRPKMGFGVPLGEWLRGPLRDWAETLLDEGRLKQEGYLIPGPIREKWSEHLSGRRNWQYHLWDVLMFQAWLETNKN